MTISHAPYPIRYLMQPKGIKLFQKVHFFVIISPKFVIAIHFFVIRKCIIVIIPIKRE